MKAKKNKTIQEDLVSCPNQKRGCDAQLVKQDVDNHVTSQCPLRWVNCEACGNRVAARDVFTHQRIKKCLENKLRQEVVRRSRALSAEVRTHQSQLKREEVRREMLKKKEFRTRLHEKVGYTPRVPSALPPGITRGVSGHQAGATSAKRGACALQWDRNSAPGMLNFSSTGSAVGTDGISISSTDATLQVSTIHMDKKSSQGANSHQGVLEQTGGSFSRLGETPSSSARTVSSRDTSAGEVDMTDLDRALATTDSVISSEDRSQSMDEDNPGPSDGESLQQSTVISLASKSRVQTCVRCSKLYVDSKNNALSCNWHIGPILPLFGGTCSSCGRLDHQAGCMHGQHTIDPLDLDQPSLNVAIRH